MARVSLGVRVMSVADSDYRALFEALPTPCLVLTPDLVIATANDAYVEATMTIREEIVGRHIFDVFPDNPDDFAASGKENLRCSLERVMETKYPHTMAVQKYDMRRPPSEGDEFEVRYWRPVNSPVLGQGGEIKYIIHRVEDVTEFVRKHSAGPSIESDGNSTLPKTSDDVEASIVNRSMELQRANRKFEELYKAKTAFLANVSHEFQTPLTLILGPLEEAISRLDPVRDSDQMRRLELSHRNARRLLGLVNDLLSFSRIEAGHVEPRFVPVDLPAMTVQLASVFVSAFEKAGIEYTIECPPMTEPVWVDTGMWEQIVLNLISNALKFTDDGKVSVSLVNKNNHVRMSVSDTGAGIPEEHIERIFDRFYRSSSPSRTISNSSGIGLALVKELSRIHGGTVEVDSTRGRGSTFTVCIPLGYEHLPIDRVSLEPVGASGSEMYGQIELDEVCGGDIPALPDRGSMATESPESEIREHVLVVDDNAEMRCYLGDILGSRFNVSFAHDGESALKAITERIPDLVLSDIMMPGIDGVELVRKLRSDPTLASVPVILLSAKTSEEELAAGLVAAAADDYLTKPFSTRELLARVSVNLRSAKLRRAGTLLEGQELERRRIATEIHDDVIQELVVLVLMIGERRESIGIDGTREELARIEDAIRRTIDKLRRLIFDLSPPSLAGQGIVAALEEHLGYVVSPSGVDWTVKNQITRRMSEEVQLSAYRIAREAIANARKHSAARKIEVEVESVDDGLRVSVEDDGEGFQVDANPFVPGHLGMIEIFDRAEIAGGWAQVSSALGKGTRVEFWLPDRGPGSPFPT